jgi:drug/metabolite transporter (DMT)-like permease
MASFLYFVPVFATLIAWVWLGEVPRFVSLAGGTGAVTGVIVVNLWGRRSLGSSRYVSN